MALVVCYLVCSMFLLLECFVVKYWFIAASVICLHYILSFLLSYITGFHEFAFFLLLIPWAGYMCLQVDEWEGYDKLNNNRTPLPSGVPSDGALCIDISGPYTADELKDLRGIKCS